MSAFYEPPTLDELRAELTARLRAAGYGDDLEGHSRADSDQEPQPTSKPEDG